MMEAAEPAPHDDMSLDEVKCIIASVISNLDPAAFDKAWNDHDWHNPGAQTHFSRLQNICAFGNKISTPDEISTPGQRLWVDNERLLFTDGNDRNKLLTDQFHVLKQQFVDAGYKVTLQIQYGGNDINNTRPASPRHIIMLGVLNHGGYVIITRMAPGFDANPHVTRIDSLGLPDIAAKTVAAWKKRDAQIQHVIDGFDTVIPAAIRKSYYDYLAPYLAGGLNAPLFRILGLENRHPEIELLLVDDKLDVIQRRYPFKLAENLWADGPVISWSFDQYGHQFIKDLNRHWQAEERLQTNGGLVATGIANYLIEKYNLKLQAKHDGQIKPLKGTVPAGYGQFLKYKIRYNKSNKGRIEAEIELHKSGVGSEDSLVFSLGTGCYFIRGQQIPEAALAALKDQPLRKLIESDLIPESLIIRHIYNKKDGVRGEVRGENVIVKSREEVENILREVTDYEMI